jgi:hypothetical protein
MLAGGGDGKDTLIGGGGDDDIRSATAMWSSRPWRPGRRNDNVAYFGTGTYVLTNNVENLYLTFAPGEVNGTGNALTNIINGNDFANVLDGKGGADTMTGGKVSDIYIFDNAGDKAIELADGGLEDQIKSSVALRRQSPMSSTTPSSRRRGHVHGRHRRQQDHRRIGQDKFDGGSGSDTWRRQRQRYADRRPGDLLFVKPAPILDGGGRRRQLRRLQFGRKGYRQRRDGHRFCSILRQLRDRCQHREPGPRGYGEHQRQRQCQCEPGCRQQRRQQASGSRGQRHPDRRRGE